MTAPAGNLKPVRSGTAAEAWGRLLAQQPVWTPRGESLVVLSTHPGEETLGAGGLIASYRQWHRPVTIVSITDGEAAYPGWQDLADIRRAELVHALHRLCAEGLTIVRLSLPDGQVGRHERALREALLALLPSGSLLVAPFEDDGYPDHATVGRMACSVAGTLEVRVARYPLWLWQYSGVHSAAGLRWGRFLLDERLRELKAHAVDALASLRQPPAGAPLLAAESLAHFDRPFEAFIL